MYTFFRDVQTLWWTEHFCPDWYHVTSQTWFDLTLNWLFITRYKKLEQGTGIFSIRFYSISTRFHYAHVSFKIIWMKTDWLDKSGWQKQMALQRYTITSALIMQTPGQWSWAPSWQNEDLVMSCSGRVKHSYSHHFFLNASDPSSLPRPLEMPAQHDFLLPCTFPSH